MGILHRDAIHVVSSMIALNLAAAWGAEPEWPRFRGPDANPVVAKGRLPEKWSKTENVEWAAEIQGRGWSSPIVNGRKVFVTTATTEGKSKTPQIGTEYSNEYVAELMKQGLSEQEVLKRVTARDIELPKEVMLHYYLYCLDIQTGKVVWKREFYSGQPTGGRPALLGDLLLIVNDNEKQQFIAAFDTKTGKPVWRTNRDLAAKGDGPQRSAWVTPFVWKNPQRREVVTVGPGAAVSYDVAGKELWRLSGMSAIPIPSPFAYDGLLYVNGGEGKATGCNQAWRDR